MNIVISDPKTRRAYSKKVDEVPPAFLNKKIGSTVSLESIGLHGFEAKVTGGSDKEGIPMHPAMEGSNRKKILSHKGIGFRQTNKGERRRKSVRGNTVFKDSSQINVVLTKGDSQKLSEQFGGRPKTGEKKVSVKEEMIARSLAAVGDDAAAEAAKTIKGKTKG